MDSQSSSMSATVEPRVFSHKRRRNGTFKLEESTGDLSGCCTTSGESSSDESDSGVEVEDFAEDEEEEEAQAAAKRRRRAELDGLKKSVREMEAQVVNASAQLRDLAALVAQVVAQRQQQSQQLHA
ncbi:hypothetical protein P3T76_006554 [Phytophthora citrophthora]|uniref:Uncharacterized protein n=1 Tax=Phytophthora citrophthora TaxID=4793 RepID=A0AAD9LNY3_9STRA|nr:hypothetical protein P3T76_006554 [Phytophthora citrophthora]